MVELWSTETNMQGTVVGKEQKSAGVQVGKPRQICVGLQGLRVLLEHRLRRLWYMWVLYLATCRYLT